MPTPYAVSSDLVSAWPAKSLEVATYLDSALASKTDTAMTQNAQTGTSYSFALADASKLLTTSNASPVSVTVTKQATVTWVTGTQLRVVNLGAGVTTLVADTGVTINNNKALAQYQGGTLIRTASDVWLFVPTASGSGMDLITPTSVAGSGVTLSGGEITFTAATTISAMGVFTSAYDNYRIYFSLTTGASGSMSMRLRSGATDASGANYAHQRADFLNTGSTFIRVSGATNWFTQTLATDWNSFSIDLFRPALAVPTSGLVMSSRETGSNIDLDIYSLGHGLSTAYDGLTIAPGSASTGKLRIYGLRNS